MQATNRMLVVMILLQLLTIFLISCGGEQQQAMDCDVSHTTPEGIQLCGTGEVVTTSSVMLNGQPHEVRHVSNIDADEVEHVLLKMQQFLEMPDLLQRLAEQDTKISFVRSSDNKLHGSNVGEAYRRHMFAIVHVSPCLAHTSLVHEVLHLVEYLKWGVTEKDHARPGFFKGELSAETVLTKELESELKSCGEGGLQ